MSPGFEKSSLNPYFLNNIDSLIESSNISHFIHGHVHSPHDYMIGQTRVLCNPRGYHHENNQFALKYFEV